MLARPRPPRRPAPIAVPDQLPYLFALGAVVLFGVSDFIYKKAHQKEIDEASFLCVQSGIVVLSLLAIGVGGVGWNLSMPALALGLGCGVLAFITAISTLYAIGRGPVTTTTAIRRLSFLVTGVLAIVFLGERLTLAKGVAIALAVAGIALMAYAPGAKERPHALTYVALLATGFLAFGHKLAALTGASPAAFLVIQASVVHASTHVMCRARGGYRFTPSAKRFAPVTGATVAAAMVLAIFALRGGEALVIVPLLQLSFLVTAPLGFLFAAEAPSTQKIVGILVGAAAVLGFGFAT